MRRRTVPIPICSSTTASTAALTCSSRVRCCSCPLPLSRVFDFFNLWARSWFLALYVWFYFRSEPTRAVLPQKRLFCWRTVCRVGVFEEVVLKNSSFFFLNHLTMDKSEEHAFLILGDMLCLEQWIWPTVVVFLPFERCDWMGITKSASSMACVLFLLLIFT